MESDTNARAQPNGMRQPTDDELRLTLASLAMATAHADPSLSADEYLALVEQKQHEMVLPDADEIACVFFTCGEQRWGARLADIRRVVPQLEGTPVPVPESPAWAAGVFRIEAEFATLIDTAQFLGERPSLTQRRQRDHGILVIAEGDALLGLFVTHLSLATTVPATDVQFVEPASEEVPATPYLLARYVPQGEANPQALGTEGFLDVGRIAADCLRALDGEDAADG